MSIWNTVKNNFTTIYVLCLIFHGGSVSAETYPLKDLFEKNVLACSYSGGNMEHPLCPSDVVDYKLELYLQGIYTNIKKIKQKKSTCVDPVEEYLQIKSLHQKVLFAFRRFCESEDEQRYNTLGAYDSSGAAHCSVAIHESARLSIVPGLNDNRLHFFTVSECIDDEKFILPLQPVKIAPGFNCDKVIIKIEKAICSDFNLAYYDNLLSSLYIKLKKSISKSEELNDLKESQREWIKLRNSSCDEFIGKPLHSCLIQAYYQRVSQLK
jgi:uncharacterized protein YecT (DUF1311 family)